MGRRERGFTLLELMIVVAVIGVLVGIAVFMYGRWVRKAQSKEVDYVFAEFRLKQEKYALENKGRYLSSGADETEMWPTPMGGRDLTEWGPSRPDGWVDLGINLDRSALHCSYVTIAGLANTPDNIGAKAIEFGFTTDADADSVADGAPATNWFYLLAECDFDADPAKNSFYFTASTDDQIYKQNPGF